MIKKVLIGLDSTPYTDTAIRHAVGLAKTYSVELTGVAGVHSSKLESVGPVPIGGSYYAKNLREFRMSETEQHVSEVIGKFEAACNAEGVSFNVKRETGNPFDLMVSYARYHDLTILSMRHPFEYGVIEESKNLLCQLIKEGVQPILACGGEFRSIKRALIAYNGSMESATAMKRFVQTRLWYDAEIRIVYFGKEDTKSRQILEDASAYCRTFGFSPDIALIEKDAKEGLLAYATEWTADMIVMGNSGLNPLVSQFFSDTTLHAIKYADRTLFLAQ